MARALPPAQAASTEQLRKCGEAGTWLLSFDSWVRLGIGLWLGMLTNCCKPCLHYTHHGNKVFKVLRVIRTEPQLRACGSAVQAKPLQL